MLTYSGSVRIDLHVDSAAVAGDVKHARPAIRVAVHRRLSKVLATPRNLGTCVFGLYSLCEGSSRVGHSNQYGLHLSTAGFSRMCCALGLAYSWAHT